MMDDKKCMCGADATEKVCMMHHEKDDSCQMEANMCTDCAEAEMQKKDS